MYILYIWTYVYTVYIHISSYPRINELYIDRIIITVFTPRRVQYSCPKKDLPVYSYYCTVHLDFEHISDTSITSMYKPVRVLYLHPASVYCIAVNCID